ncbi:MAG TPA: hypothetical protein VOA19_11885 [Actinomycetes bacterium]|jgi:hypothetical protein|nr:hypothetical protein [Actinomycetes bacterium]
MPDLWDTNPDNVFRTAEEESHPPPPPSDPDDHTGEVKLKDHRGRLRLPAYILIAMLVVLVTTMWLTVVLLAASR